MAGDINRVTLVGRLTRDPELQPPAVRHARCSSSASPSTAAAGRGRAMGRQAELLRRQGVRQPGREPRPVPGKGRRIGVDGRLDWRVVGGAGRRQAPKVESSPQTVQFLDSRSDGEGGALHPGRAAAARPGRRRLPARRRRRRHPVLGDRRMAQKSTAAQAPELAHAPPGGARAATSARTRSQRSTTRTSTSFGATSRRRARSATAGSPARAGATSGRSPWRVKRAREMALLPYVASVDRWR